MTTTIYSKPSYYGGSMFVKYNDKTKKLYVGNTASTAVAPYHADLQISGVTMREVKATAKRLLTLGYKEHEIKWSGKLDSSATYQAIAKAGL